MADLNFTPIIFFYILAVITVITGITVNIEILNN